MQKKFHEYKGEKTNLPLIKNFHVKETKDKVIYIRTIKAQMQFKTQQQMKKF